MSSRRNFIKKSGLAIGAAVLIKSFLKNGLLASDSEQSGLTNSLGFQVWPIRQELTANIKDTLQTMANMGYKEVEMCSPFSFSEWGFEPLKKFSGKALRNIIEDSGLTCTSCHYNVSELRDHFNDRIEWTQQLGLKQMIIAEFPLPEKNYSIDDYRKATDEMNIIGEKIKAEGLQLGFHNHLKDFKELGGKVPYDVVLKQSDPDLVKMQFQVSVIKSGVVAADYFTKFPGRFISAHLSDWAANERRPVPVGQGEIDWNEFFEAAKVGGIKNVYVEVQPEMYEPSARFLLKL